MILSREEFLNRLAKVSGHSGVSMMASHSWKICDEHDAAQRARIAELTDALKAEQDRRANMTRLFDESDADVKRKDARIAELEAGLREDRFNLDSWKTVVDNCLAEMQLIRKERDAAMAAMEDATRQNAIQVDRLVSEARELREKLEAADARIAELEKALTQSRVQETRNYLASPAMETFVDLKHSQAGTVLAMLGDGAISRGKCCEALAQLAHGVPFDEIPLPQENGRQFTLDEIPAEVVAKLESEVEALRKDAFTVLHLRGVLEKVRLRGGLGSDKSDSQVAGAIRMMAREDVDHEMACVMARDRIIALSDAVETTRKERDAAIRQIVDEQAISVQMMRERDTAIAAIADAQRIMAEFKHIYPEGFPGDFTTQPEHLASQVTSICNDNRCNFQNFVQSNETARELRKKLEAAEKDTARLDYTFIVDTNVAVTLLSDEDCGEDEWLNSREAIDAAMSAADQEQG